MPKTNYGTGSPAEDLFVELFADAFGAERAKYLYHQYSFYDIYQNNRFADFVLENGAKRIAFEIDDQASHDKSIINQD
ncbi:MAG: ATP-dependent helicase, partial [Clostridia bacterium]